MTTATTVPIICVGDSCETPKTRPSKTACSASAPTNINNLNISFYKTISKFLRFLSISPESRMSSWIEMSVIILILIVLRMLNSALVTLYEVIRSQIFEFHLILF